MQIWHWHILIRDALFFSLSGWCESERRTSLPTNVTNAGGDEQFAWNRIVTGLLAKDLERYLREAIPSLYGNLQIKLMKIMWVKLKMQFLKHFLHISDQWLSNVFCIAGDGSRVETITLFTTHGYFISKTVPTNPRTNMTSCRIIFPENRPQDTGWNRNWCNYRAFCRFPS